MNRAIFPLLTEEVSKLPLYVKSIGGSDPQEHISRPSGYPDYHWLHCTSGKGRLLIGSKEYTISENMGFFFYPFVPHEYYTVSGPWTTHWLTFNGSNVPELLDALKLGTWTVFNLSDMHPLDRLLNDIYISAQVGNPSNGYETSALLYQFLIETRKYIITGDLKLRNDRHKQLQPVISYMEKNFCKNPTLEEMAELINVTSFHLCRLFKQTYNMRPFEYLNRYRLQKAKEMIIGREDITVKEVARRIGYNDASYFCSMFREYEGITPTEFRRMHKVE